MPTSYEHKERVLRHQQIQSERRALQITSGWLSLLVRTYAIDEGATRATIRHDGAVIAECTLAEALDMANAALDYAVTADAAPRANTFNGE